MKAQYVVFSIILLSCGGQSASTQDDGTGAPPPPADTSGGTPGATPPPATPPPGTTLADDLVFAVVGDTRPPSENDISAYPTSIITSIYADVAKRRPLFVVGTGDYQFASTYGNSAADQMAIYMKARTQVTVPFYPAMGNHECTGGTASNCGAEGHDGLTANYKTFLSQMLAPIGQTEPYYTVHVAAKDQSWTAKFVFIALNAWSTTQATWFDGAMSEQTTYTFVVHHEPAFETQAPGQSAAQAILAKHPYTLALVGHTHTYRKPYGSSKEVVIGNGGAPATGSINYGYGLFHRRADGAVAADMIDWQTAQPTPSLAFAVKADGTLVP
jgi:hypothetical protein